MRVAQFEREGLANVSGRNSIQKLFASIRGALPSDFETTVVHCPTPAHHRFWLWQGLKRAWRARSEVNHIVGDVHYAALALPRGRTILTVCDTIHLEEMRGFRRLVYRSLYFSWPLRRSAYITAISESTRQSLIKKFPWTESRIRVIPCCYSGDFAAHRQEFNDQSPTILQIGTRPNKNLERVAKSLRNIPCRLKIVGRVSQEQADLLEDQGIDFESSEDLTDEEILQCYIDADLVVFVSIAEGFGMPVIEAQAIGRPLVTSRLEPMASIAGSGACLVDPHDPEDIRRGVLRIIRDPEYREALVTRGLENSRQYTSEAIGAQYASLYRQVASGGSA
jgi:glycosyltransferase involved in cell wall biosynthesis